jgi:hypothetical protein
LNEGSSRSSTSQPSPTGTPASPSGPSVAPVELGTRRIPLETGRGAEERRRSQRVLLRVRARVHVSLEGKAATLDVTTLSVNAHGALVVMQRGLPTDTRLVLEHCGTRQMAACRTVRAPREMPEGFHVPLEFDSAAPDFWKIAFPPADWRHEEEL